MQEFQLKICLLLIKILWGDILNSEIQGAFFNDNYAQFSKETARCYRIALNQFFYYCKKDYDLIKASDHIPYVIPLVRI